MKKNPDRQAREVEKSADQPLDLGRSGRTMLIAAVLACVVARIVPAFLIYGTEDVFAWDFAAKCNAAHANVYLQNYPFNWPPVWLSFQLQMVAWADAWHLPLCGFAKILPILADALVTALIYLALARLTSDRRKALVGSLLYALNPVSVAVTAVHGNLIAVPLALLVASAYALHFGRGRWSLVLSAFLFGFAVMTKTWPILFLPLMLLRARTWGDRATYVGVSILAPALGALQMLSTYGADALRRCVAYQSIPGWWGFTSLFEAWDNPATRNLAAWYAAHGIVVLGLAVLALYALRARKTEFFSGFVMVALAMLFFAQGFGPQYLLWALPFAILARDRWVWAFTVLVTALFVAEYGFRPYIGEIGAMLHGLAGPQLTSEQRLYDRHLTDLLRLPVWVFLGAWMVAAALRAGKFEIRSTKSETSTNNQNPK